MKGVVAGAGFETAIPQGGIMSPTRGLHHMEVPGMKPGFLVETHSTFLLFQQVFEFPSFGVIRELSAVHQCPGAVTRGPA
jgi:hypothetical protein